MTKKDLKAYYDLARQLAEENNCLESFLIKYRIEYNKTSPTCMVKEIYACDRALPHNLSYKLYGLIPFSEVLEYQLNSK